MRTPVIEFDIHDFENHTDEHFVVENNDENLELIYSHCHTRDIQFTKMFDFEFDKKERIPVEFIDPVILMTVVLEHSE